MTKKPTREVLEEWLRTNNFNAPAETTQAHVFFPSDETLSFYLDHVGERSETEVIDLLWRMLAASTTVADTKMFYAIRTEILEIAQKRTNGPLGGGSFKRIHWREKTGMGDAWEGMTWALEMLPSRPGSAIDALNLYLLSQHDLPDNRIRAVSDAIDIIHTRWIGSPGTLTGRVALLKTVDPRKFEAIIASLWRNMGYNAILTSASRDGGFDVHATKTLLGREESILIECKRYVDKKFQSTLSRGFTVSEIQILSTRDEYW